MLCLAWNPVWKNIFSMIGKPVMHCIWLSGSTMATCSYSTTFTRVTVCVWVHAVWFYYYFHYYCRMLFWNFFFPIFRDYPFRYSESSKLRPDDWAALQASWIFWLLVTTTCVLAFLLTVFLSFSLRQKFQHSRPVISNNNSTSRSHSNSTPIDYRVTQNLWPFS